MNLSLNIIKKGVIFLAILGLFLSFSAPVWAGSMEKGNQNKEIIPKIDSEAAFSVREKNIGQKADSEKFPEKFWVFLFGVYLFLLVFNLSFGLKKKKKQWFWELLITLLALWTWKKLDPSQNFRWFYYCILESSVIIYFFYLYSFLTSSKKEE